MRRLWLLLSLTIALALVTLLIGAPGLTPARAAAAPTFSDVPETYSYYTAIEGMAAANVINGYAVGDHWEFRPENLVTRAQFAKMIVSSLGLPVTEQDISTFLDVWEGVSPDLYPDHYIALAAKKGITTGYANGNFGLLDNIKRGQISTMMVRAAQNLEPGKLVAAPAGYLSDWGDIGEADGLFTLLDPAVRQLIKTSDSLGISRSSAGLAGVRDRVDFYRAYGHGEVIDKIADEFWPWED